jgi:redox-sensitive bicupin YhaK (pirin superfamily)
MVYAFEGAIEIGAREVRDGQLAVLGAGEIVQLRTSRPGRVLLLAGVSHREPVARYGPFVMNTEEELVQAIRDFGLPHVDATPPRVDTRVWTPG